MKKIFLIAGGGTGGHIYPGVAIARALESLDTNIEVEFVGSNLGLEKKIIPREGYKLHTLSAGKLNYKGSFFSKFLGLIKVGLGLCQAVYLIFKTKPSGVLGVGGYASAPLVLASALLRVPTFIWEPNAHPGLANRFLSRFVSRAFVVFEAAKKHLKSKEIYLVGLPVRSELEGLSEKRDFSGDFNVLCFGGSQGAGALNSIFEKAVRTESQWLHQARLIHQTGVSDYSKVKSTYDQSVFDVKVYEYLFEMEQYYSWATVAVCRSGASTIAELAAVGMPSILIPLPTSADDHQRKNAKVLADQGAVILLEQKEFTPEKLNELLLDLQKNRNHLKSLSNNIKSIHQPFAAKVIAQHLLKALVIVG